MIEIVWPAIRWDARRSVYGRVTVVEGKLGVGDSRSAYHVVGGQPVKSFHTWDEAVRSAIDQRCCPHCSIDGDPYADCPHGN